mmetsp:Transcript_12929/g.11051  ORF Transcript_12929/g.11051 Transcript_12929/m.11051 type:complete len:117 (-) Transcript_12929:418-768(-)
MLRTPTSYEKVRPRHSSIAEITTNHQDRLTRLSHKLGELRIYTEGEKTKRVEQIDRRLKLLEESLFEHQEAFTKKLNSVKDSAVLLQRNADGFKQESDLYISNHHNEFQAVEDKIN